MAVIINIFIGIFGAIGTIGRTIGIGVLALVLLVSAFVGYVWLVNSRQASFTFKISVVAAIDGKPVTASAVQRIVVQRNWGPPFPNIDGTTSRAQGAAVYLPVDANSGLALLMGGIGPESRFDYTTQLLQICGLNRRSPDAEIAAVATFSGPCALAPAKDPMLVSISNLSDPNSIAQVADPASASVNGHKVSVSRVTLERVDDPVDGCLTFQKLLPWLFARHPSPQGRPSSMQEALQRATLERAQLQPRSFCSDSLV